MAGIRQPVEDILALLSTLDVTNQDGNAAKLYARVWNNQVKYETNGTTYNFAKPAAFLEVLNSPQFGELGQYIQGADLGWKVHLVHEFYNQDGTMEQDLTIFDLRDSIVALLSGYEATACGPLVRTSEYQDYEHSNIYHYVIDFVCHFIDSKGSPQDAGAGKLIIKPPTTDIEMDITKLSSVPDYAGLDPENRNTTFQPNQKFNIPQ